MAKKPSRSKLVKQLDSIFSIYIRRKDSVNNIATCFTCGKKDHYKKLQNGHFQSRRHYSTRWLERNCAVQCIKCNIFLSGQQFIFGQNLDIKFGEGTARQLHIQAQKILKITNADIIEKIKLYKSFVDKL